MPLTQLDPPADCALCPRLVSYREENRAAHGDWHNAPVPTFGELETARVLIVGRAPGVSGANRTGRPFTGDFAGGLLYPTLAAHGFASGTFDARADDGLRLHGAAVTNAVRCVPPKNKPVGAEINACRPFLKNTIAAMPKLVAILALGRIAHDTVLRTLGERLAAYPFAHGALHKSLTPFLADSYHPSRYNVNTGVLNEDMFSAVLAALRSETDRHAA